MRHFCGSRELTFPGSACLRARLAGPGDVLDVDAVFPLAVVAFELRTSAGRLYFTE